MGHLVIKSRTDKVGMLAMRSHLGATGMRGDHKQEGRVDGGQLPLGCQTLKLGRACWSCKKPVWLGAALGAPACRHHAQAPLRGRGAVSEAPPGLGPAPTARGTCRLGCLQCGSRGQLPTCSSSRSGEMVSTETLWIPWSPATSLP